MNATVSGNNLVLVWHMEGATLSAQDGPGGVFGQVILSAESAKELLAALDAIRADIVAMKEGEDDKIIGR